jgi:hypothetical protein
MKKIFLFVFLSILLNKNINAQGNLQFNQVISQSYSASVASDVFSTMGTIIVPPSKVLKIESVGFYPNNGSAAEGAVLIGGQVAYTKSVFNSTGMYEMNNCPIWLGEGTYLFQVRHKWGSSVNVRSSFSAIEFNIIP